MTPNGATSPERVAHAWLEMIDTGKLCARFGGGTVSQAGQFRSEDFWEQWLSSASLCSLNMSHFKSLGLRM